jgi:hypothetical protein
VKGRPGAEGTLVAALLSLVVVGLVSPRRQVVSLALALEEAAQNLGASCA